MDDFSEKVKHPCTAPLTLLKIFMAVTEEQRGQLLPRDQILGFLMRTNHNPNFHRCLNQNLFRIGFSYKGMDPGLKKESEERPSGRVAGPAEEPASKSNKSADQQSETLNLTKVLPSSL